MWEQTFGKSTWTERIKTKPIAKIEGDDVFDRQTRISGFDQRELSKSTVLLAGAGGLGSVVGWSLVKKGIGGLKIFDPDVVEATNLPRQHFFRDDLGKRKAPVLARNLSLHATAETVLEAHACRFEKALENDLNLDASVYFCGIDEAAGRIAVSKHARISGKPAVFTAVDRAAERLYVFVQEPGLACFGCVFPDCLTPKKAPCRTPACLDVLLAAAGLVSYALDGCLMDRPRAWNYRNLHLAGFAPSGQQSVVVNPDCPLCGGNGA